MNFIFPNSWDDDPQICFICVFLYLIGGLEHFFLMTFHISGISSSQLTNLIFLEGRHNHQSSISQIRNSRKDFQCRGV